MSTCFNFLRNVPENMEKFPDLVQKVLDVDLISVDSKSITSLKFVAKVHEDNFNAPLNIGLHVWSRSRNSGFFKSGYSVTGVSAEDLFLEPLSEVEPYKYCIYGGSDTREVYRCI